MQRSSIVFRIHSSLASLLAAALFAPACWALDVGVVGLFPGKAVLVIDGGSPRTLSVGARTPDGVKLLGVEEGDAILEIDGKRHRIGIGQQVYSNGGAAEGRETVTLNADASGHFMTVGTINGAPMRFMVDTGATVVSLGASDARRANIDFAKGQPMATMTANGVAKVWRVTLNSIRIGAVQLNGVEAAVHESDLPVALLGMSFLNRMEMQRNGETMTLRRRY